MLLEVRGHAAKEAHSDSYYKVLSTSIESLNADTLPAELATTLQQLFSSELAQLQHDAAAAAQPSPPATAPLGAASQPKAIVASMPTPDAVKAEEQLTGRLKILAAIWPLLATFKQQGRLPASLERELAAEGTVRMLINQFLMPEIDTCAQLRADGGAIQGHSAASLQVRTVLACAIGVCSVSLLCEFGSAR